MIWQACCVIIKLYDLSVLSKIIIIVDLLLSVTIRLRKKGINFYKNAAVITSEWSPTRWGLAFKWIVKSFLSPLDSVHETHVSHAVQTDRECTPSLLSAISCISFFSCGTPAPFLFLSYFCSFTWFLSFQLSSRSIVSPSSLAVEGNIIEPSRSVYPAAVFKCRFNAPWNYMQKSP